MSSHPAGSLPPAVRSYVTGVVLLGVVATVLVLSVLARAPDPLRVALWTAVFLAGEAMWLKTPTGKANVSMAMVVHLAAVPVEAAFVLLPAVWLSRLLSDLILQRQAWYKAAFNAAQVSLAVAAAALVYLALGGPVGSAPDSGAWRTVLPLLAVSGLAYYAVNVGLVVGVIALTGATDYRTAWRENYGYRVELVSSMALFLLAPVCTVTYQTLGVFGIGLFLLPMLFIRDAGERYIALERAQAALVGSERLAAKGEVAASVAHELNNYLSVLSGNLQMIQIKGLDPAGGEGRKRLDGIEEQVRRMTVLSRGLMDFSRLESRPEPTDLSLLVDKTMDFLRPQNRFDGVSIRCECDPRVGVLTVDPGQIQQVLMNLLNNASDAIRDSDDPIRSITLRTEYRDLDRAVRLSVINTGPHIPDEHKPRIFEPGFSTKADGHGFGLSTVFRIVANHGGTIEVVDAPGGGTWFRIDLPHRERDRAAA